MADVVREIERKYETTDNSGAVELPDLRVSGVADVVDKGTLRLDARYYDTADGRLAADGITLRRRTGGSDAGWHLKLPVRPGVRDEIRAPLSDDIPATLTALVRSRVRSRPLAPVMRLRSERAVRHLLDSTETLLAEVAVDRVRAARLPGGATACWTEIEVEQGPAGSTRLLDRIEKRLFRAGGLRRASTGSKLEHALAATAPVPERKKPKEPKQPKERPERTEHTEGSKRTKRPGRRQPVQDPAAGEYVLRYVRAQVNAVVALDPAVRRDLPDSVHRMRVALRRLRSCFRSYAAVLDRTVTDPVGEELKWLAGELGVDRDREVLTARLADGIAQLPPGLQHGPVRGRLRTFSRARRTGSRQRLIAVLDGGRYLALLETLEELLADPPLRPKAARPPEKVIAKAVRRDFGRLADRIGRGLAAPPGEGRDGELHEARKAAKRARYSAEAARAAFGEPAKAYAARMTELQDLLGEHQDSVLAREALREIARQAHAAGEPSFTYGVLHARESASAEECERALPGLWQSMSPAGHRGLG